MRLHHALIFPHLWKGVRKRKLWGLRQSKALINRTLLLSSPHRDQFVRLRQKGPLESLHLVFLGAVKSIVRNDGTASRKDKSICVC
jgi:hypothetical protein